MTPALKRSQRTGYIYVVVPQPGKRSRWVSTGCTCIKKAKEVVESTGVAKLLALHNAEALTAEAISTVTTGRKFTLADVAKQWREDQQMTASESTADAYFAHVDQFLRVHKCAGKASHVIHRLSVNSFINDQKVSSSTRKARLTAMRSFCAFATGSGHTFNNPTVGLKVQTRLLTIAQRQQEPATPFTQMQYDEILAATTGFWHWATVLSWHLGYRLVDVACMERASLASPEKILIYPSKTGRRLEIGLEHPFIRSDKLLATLDEIRLQSSDPVYCFPLQREIRLSHTRRALLTVQFKNILKRLNYDSYSFHGLRHSFKLRMDAAGLTLEQIAGLMGHSSTKQTERYGRAATPGGG